MNKKIIAALLAGTVLLSCSFAATKKAKTTKKSKNSKVTLTVWESTNGPDEFIRKAGEAYTKTHPNVTIKYVNVELGDAVTQIALDGPAGVGPDLFAAPHDRLGSLVSGGHVLPTANEGITTLPPLSNVSATISKNNSALSSFLL